MATLFDDIIAQGVRAGQIPARERTAREWYRDSAKNVSNVNERKLLRGEPDRLTSRPMIGSMYMFYYDAKHKDTLPYWDRFPLIFPYKMVKGGFYGLNLHYLPLPLRARLMNGLYETTQNTRYDESTRLKINYQMLNGASRFKGFRPCVKHYLNSQLKSRFMYVYPSEWDIALFLPTERFQKASKQKVFADSRKMLR